jgi:hypothetical protein
VSKGARRARTAASLRSEAAYAAHLAGTALTALHAGDMARAGAAHHELRFCLVRVAEVLALAGAL